MDNDPDMEGYVALMKIDPDALDVEWLEQPGAFMTLAKEQSKAKRAIARANEDLKTLEAGKARKIRKRPGHYGFSDKLTEGGIKEAVTEDEEVKQARADLIDLQYDLDMLTNAMRAMEHRKQALEELVKLHGQQYFAGPREPRNLSLESGKEILRKEARDKVRSHRTK